MKKIIIAITFSLLASTSFAGGIDDFKDLKKRLFKGDDVKALLYTDKCDSDIIGKKDNVGGFTVSSWYLGEDAENSKAVILASTHHFTIHHEFGPVYQILNLKINENDRVNIHMVTVEPNTYNVLDENTFVCKIDKGIKFEKM